MADPTLDKSKFNLSYLVKGEGIKDWYKALGAGVKLFIIGIVIVGVFLVFWNIWSFFRPKPAQNVNKPTTIVLPGAHVDKIDQTSTQVLLDEKPWEVGVGAGGLTYDNKTGAFIGGWVRRKW